MVYPEIIFLIKVLSLGLIFFSIGYFILNIFNLKKISYNLNQINNYETYVIITFILYICFYYVNYEIKLFKSSIFAQLKQPTMLFVLSYLQIKYLITKNFFYLMSLIIVFFLLFFIEASFGATVFPFMMISMLLLLSFYKSRKINLVSILIIFVAIYGVHSLKNSIRKVTWTTFPEQDNTNNKKLFKEAQLKNNEILFRIKKSANIYINESDLVLDLNRFNTLKKRLFHSNVTLQTTITQSPDVISFYNGESYKGIIYKFIPRFLYDSKPKEEWGNFWGKKYQVLLPFDTGTSWNYPVLSEFYANFGVKGVICGMFLLGIAVKILLILLSFNFGQPVLLSMSSTILLNFFFLESNLSLILGSVINQILIFSLIIFLICFLNFLIKQIRNFKVKV